VLVTHHVHLSGGTGGASLSEFGATLHPCPLCVQRTDVCQRDDLVLDNAAIPRRPWQRPQLRGDQAPPPQSEPKLAKRRLELSRNRPRRRSSSR
jgi:hypothetical protein